MTELLYQLLHVMVIPVKTYSALPGDWTPCQPHRSGNPSRVLLSGAAMSAEAPLPKLLPLEHMMFSFSLTATRPGFEPGTFGTKNRCSAS